MGFWGYHGVVSIILYFVDIAFAITFLLRVTEVIPPEFWKYFEILLAGIALAANVAYWIFLGCCGMLYISDETMQENDLRSQHHSKSTIAYIFAVITQMVFVIMAARVDPIDPDVIITFVAYNPAMMTSYTTQKVAAGLCLVFSVFSLSTITDYYYYRRTDKDAQMLADANTQGLLSPSNQWTAANSANKSTNSDIDDMDNVNL
jgi:hypothetical protein